MNPVIRYSALFLLLLFVRVMIPDEVLLSRHHHVHTEHTDSISDLQAKVEKEHTHCPVEDLFEASFQGTQLRALPKPLTYNIIHAIFLPVSQRYSVNDHWPTRGPPAV